MAQVSLLYQLVDGTYAYGSQVYADLSAITAAVNGGLDSTNINAAVGIGANFIKSSGLNATGIFGAGSYNFTAGSAAQTPLTVAGVASQTANIFSVATSTATTVWVDQNGVLNTTLPPIFGGEAGGFVLLSPAAQQVGSINVSAGITTGLGVSVNGELAVYNGTPGRVDNPGEMSTSTGVGTGRVWFGQSPAGLIDFGISLANTFTFQCQGTSQVAPIICGPLSISASGSAGFTSVAPSGMQLGVINATNTAILLGSSVTALSLVNYNNSAYMPFLCGNVAAGNVTANGNIVGNSITANTSISVQGLLQIVNQNIQTTGGANYMRLVGNNPILGVQIDNDYPGATIVEFTSQNTLGSGLGAFIGANGAYTSFSDVRGKKNLRPSPHGLDAVLTMKPTLYDMVAEQGAKDQLGFIAQDMLNVVPNAVNYNERHDAYGIAYDALVPVLVQAIQELNAKVQTLEARLL